MNKLMLQLSIDIQALDAVIQPFKWSNNSKTKLQSIFKRMDKTLTEAESWCDRNLHEEDQNSEIEFWDRNYNNKKISLPVTKLKFSVTDKLRPNTGLCEGCANHYIDMLTEAYESNDLKSRNDALYALIDIAKAMDREIDPEAEPYDMLDDQHLRADSATHDYWRQLKYPEEDIVQENPEDPKPTLWTFEHDDPECVRKLIRSEGPDDPFESSYMKSLKGKKFIRACDVVCVGRGFVGFRGCLIQFQFDNGIPADQTYTTHTELCLYFNDNDSLITLNQKGEETAWSVDAIKDIMVEIGQFCQVWYYVINRKLSK